MYVICQDSIFSSAIEAITEAVSLLELKQEKNRINKRIQSLLHIADDLAPDSVEYQCVYERILELERMRELIRRRSDALEKLSVHRFMRNCICYGLIEPKRPVARLRV